MVTRLAASTCLIAATCSAAFGPAYSPAQVRPRSTVVHSGGAEIRAGPAGLYDKATVLGAAKAELPLSKLFALGIVSGAHIALGAFLSVSVGGMMPTIKATNPGVQRAMMGVFGLPMGLMMTVACGGELVTGNMALCTAAWLEKRTTLKKVLRNFAIVLSANFVGSILLAAIANTAATGVTSGAVAVATGKVTAPVAAIFARGILCNWLVCMGVWMATSTPDLGAKAASVIFPISGFVALGLEHSVANMFLIPFGILQGAEISIADMFFKNLIPCTLGNLVGGAAFVASFYRAAYGITK